VLWNRGLLRKGYGICHGVAGNAYGFLTAYQLTGDQKYIYQAIKVDTFSNTDIFRSTLLSRPNKVGLKCPFVRPQKLSSISMKFGM